METKARQAEVSHGTHGNSQPFLAFLMANISMFQASGDGGTVSNVTGADGGGAISTFSGLESAACYAGSNTCCNCTGS